MRRYDVIAEICDAMLALGWQPYQNDHEDANGQFEMNWEYDSALITADRHAFFKYMVKSIAEKHGLRATFMPKPFPPDRQRLPRACLAVVGKTGKNLFADANGELGLSRSPIISSAASCIRRRAVRHHQSDGEFLQAHQRAADIVGRDLVPEHGHLRRQQPHPHDPHSRRRPLRAPPRRRRRQPVSAAGALLVAGLDGIKNKRDPGKRLDIDMYTEGHK
jgi:hypothetical protein